MNARVSGVMVAAIVGLGIIPSVAASAAVPDADGTVHACYGKVGGVVRVIEPARGERCLPKAEAEFTFNQAGQPGAAGVPGPAGAAGVSPTVAQLAVGDQHCPAGGAAITDAAGSKAYVCSGAAGRDGADGADGAPFSGTFTSPNGAYSISVTDQGVSLQHGTSGLTLVGDSLQIRGTDLTVRVDGSADVQVGTGLQVTTGSGLTMRVGTTLAVDVGGSAQVQADGSMKLQGSHVQLNPGVNCPPAARVGDQVAVAASGAAIVGGSSSVCIGG